MSELERINALHAYNILDNASEQDFDDIVELASIICDAPISLISLIDSDRQWFKSAEGLRTKETERKYSFCHYAIKNPSKMMVVQDFLLDDRFKTNPFVINEPKIRFYAGSPLVNSEGYALGTLCVLDVVPRTLNEKEERALRKLSERVMTLLELRKENIRQKAQLSEKEAELNLMIERFIQAQHIAQIGSWDWNVLTDELYWSPEMFKIYEIGESTEDLLNTWQSKVHPEDLSFVKKTLEDGLKKNKPDSIQYRIIREDGSVKWVETTGTVKSDASSGYHSIQGTVQDITVRKIAEDRRLQYAKTLEEILYDFSHHVRQPLANCIGAIHAINFEDISIEKSIELINHFKKSAFDFDSMIRNMSAFVYKSKSDIS